MQLKSLIYFSFILITIILFIVLYQFFNIEKLLITFIFIADIILLFYLNKKDYFISAYPTIWFSIAFIVYHILPILVYLFRGNDYLSYSSDIFLLTSFYSLIGLLFFIFGYNTKMKKKISITKNWSRKVILMISAVFFLIYLVYNRYSSYPLLMISRLETICCLFAITAILTDYHRHNNGKKRIADLIILIIILITFFFLSESNSRRDFLKLIIPLIIIISIYRRPLKIKTLSQWFRVQTSTLIDLDISLRGMN